MSEGRQDAVYTDDRRPGKATKPGRSTLLLQPLKFASSQHTQTSSPLFQLPGEMRQCIFRFALAEHEDPMRPYPNNCAYRRPGQRGRYRIDTALLQTCQQAYREGGHLPLSNAEHTFFLTATERRPEHPDAVTYLAPALYIYMVRHGLPELTDVTVLAQLCELECGVNLGLVLGIPFLHLRSLMIVIRHSDWWQWEQDEPLHIGPCFTNKCIFPTSVAEIRFELETTVRRKGQLERIAGMMRKAWELERKDGVRLRAANQPRVTFTWTGNAQWLRNREHFHRVRSFTSVLDFFVEVVTFRPTVPGPHAFPLNNPGLDLRPGHMDIENLRSFEISETSGSENQPPKARHWDYGHIDSEYAD